MILYKGGTIEKNLCHALGMTSFNIENFKGLEKAYSHEPSEEVYNYYNQLVKLGCF